MKIVLQRVREASVEVAGEVVGGIGRGVCLLVGVEKGDSRAEADWLARKVLELRIFPDDTDRMNLSLQEIGGEALVVSQFTLAASVLKGRRPSFDRAEDPAAAKSLFDAFTERVRDGGIRVATGVFAAVMEVRIVNDGPVTFVLERRTSLK